MKDLFDKVTQWQQETFPLATNKSILKHLRKEVDEVEISINQNTTDTKQDLSQEIVDCLFLLFGVAKKNGIEYCDLIQAAEQKLETNKKEIGLFTKEVCILT